jgi:hypothetical protein
VDGTWAAAWKAAQDRPKHLISNSSSDIECTCGERFASITEWASHCGGREVDLP